MPEIGRQGQPSLGLPFLNKERTEGRHSEEKAPSHSLLLSGSPFESDSGPTQVYLCGREKSKCPLQVEALADQVTTLLEIPTVILTPDQLLSMEMLLFN